MYGVVVQVGDWLRLRDVGVFEGIQLSEYC